MKIIVKLAAAACSILAVTSAGADVIVQNATASTTTGTAYYVGESFQTPADFLYYNLTFNFYSDVPATTPTAAGTAFLLSQPYTGTPAALSVTTPGFLTESTGSTGGIYTFNPNFVLLTGAEYYLYTNAALTVSGGDVFPNATTYLSGRAAGDFAAIATNADFSVNGTRVGLPLVPEPSSQTALYVLSGVVGLGFVVLRRRALH